MKTYSLETSSLQDIVSTTTDILHSGGTVIGPTDTVYGIFGDATNEEAIQKMFALKKRPKEKAFPVFVRDIAMARRYAYISDAKAKFLEKVWPGKVTVIFHKKEKLPDMLTAGTETIGMRLPAHPFLQELLAQLEAPLAQTSANVSGMLPAKNIEDVKKYFDGAETEPDIVIDAGSIESPASTVIDFTDNTPLLIRTGLISKSELDTLLSEIR